MAAPPPPGPGPAESGYLTPTGNNFKYVTKFKYAEGILLATSLRAGRVGMNAYGQQIFDSGHWPCRYRSFQHGMRLEITCPWNAHPGVPPPPTPPSGGSGAPSGGNGAPSGGGGSSKGGDSEEEKVREFYEEMDDIARDSEPITIEIIDAPRRTEPRPAPSRLSDADLVAKFFPKGTGGSGVGSSAAGSSLAGSSRPISSGAGMSSAAGPSGSTTPKRKHSDDESPPRARRTSSAQVREFDFTEEDLILPPLGAAINVSDIVKKDRARKGKPFVPTFSPWGKKTHVRPPPPTEDGYILDALERRAEWIEVRARILNPNGLSRRALAEAMTRGLSSASELLTPIEDDGMDVDAPATTASGVQRISTIPRSSAVAPISSSASVSRSSAAIPRTSAAIPGSSAFAPVSFSTPRTSAPTATVSGTSAAPISSASTASAAPTAASTGSARSGVPSGEELQLNSRMRRLNEASMFFLQELQTEFEAVETEDHRREQLRMAIREFRQRATIPRAEVERLFRNNPTFDEWIYVHRIMRSERNNALFNPEQREKNRRDILMQIVRVLNHYHVQIRDPDTRHYIQSMPNVIERLGRNASLFDQHWEYGTVIDDILLNVGDNESTVRREWLRLLREILIVGDRFLQQRGAQAENIPALIELEPATVVVDSVAADGLRLQFLRDQIPRGYNRFAEIMRRREEGMISWQTERARAITDLLLNILQHDDNVWTRELRTTFDILMARLEQIGPFLRFDAPLRLFLETAEVALRSQGYFWNMRTQLQTDSLELEPSDAILTQHGGIQRAAYPATQAGNPEFQGSRSPFRVFRVDRARMSLFIYPIYPPKGMNPRQNVYEVEILPSADIERIRELLLTTPDLPNIHYSIHPQVKVDCFNRYGDLELAHIFCNDPRNVHADNGVRFEGEIATIMVPYRTIGDVSRAILRNGLIRSAPTAGGVYGLGGAVAAIATTTMASAIRPTAAAASVAATPGPNSVVILSTPTSSGIGIASSVTVPMAPIAKAISQTTKVPASITFTLSSGQAIPAPTVGVIHGLLTAGPSSAPTTTAPTGLLMSALQLTSSAPITTAPTTTTATTTTATSASSSGVMTTAAITDALSAVTMSDTFAGPSSASTSFGSEVKGKAAKEKSGVDYLIDSLGRAYAMLDKNKGKDDEPSKKKDDNAGGKKQ